MLVQRSYGTIFVRKNTLDCFHPWDAGVVAQLITDEYGGRPYSHATTDTDSTEDTVIITVVVKRGDFFGTLEPVKVPRNPKEASAVQLARIIENLRGKLHRMIEQWEKSLPKDFEEVEM